MLVRQKWWRIGTVLEKEGAKLKKKPEIPFVALFCSKIEGWDGAVHCSKKSSFKWSFNILFCFFFLLFNSSIEPPNYPISVSLFVRHIKTILLVRREFQNELLIRAWKKERDCFSSFGSRFFFWKNLARTIIDDEQCGVEDENENQQKNKDRKRKPKLDPSFNSITNSEVCARKTKILLPPCACKTQMWLFFRSYFGIILQGLYGHSAQCHFF